MAIQMRNRRSAEFSMASMSDLVFLLLIFFMLTSTLVSPNAVKLLLPNSNTRTLAPQRSTTVYINDQFQYYVEDTPVNEMMLVQAIELRINGQTESSIVLRADKSVPVQYVVTVIDAVNQINDKNKTKHKVILATKPKE